jgi:hypothetical protein
LRLAAAWGVAFVVIVGSLMHFAWEWSGRSVVVAVAAAVNESVWEHLKLLYWPFVWWAVGMWVYLRGRGVAAPPGYWSGKALGALLGPLLIVGLHYGYRAVTGAHVVWLDVLIFVVAAAGAQWAALLVAERWRHNLGLAQPADAWAAGVGLAVLAAMAVVYGVYTFWPPQLPLWLDSVTGGYGIPRGW